MIKRAGAFTLTLLYLVTMAGFVLNLHYCFNRITAVDINTPAKSCGMITIKKMDCCKDRHFVVKVNDAHQGQAFSALSAPQGFTLPRLSLANFSLSAQQAFASVNFQLNSPDPPPDNVTSYLKNRVFRI